MAKPTRGVEPIDESAALDPVEYLTRMGARSVDAAKLYANIALAANRNVLIPSDAAALEVTVVARAEAGATLFQALCDDGRLPEGVRVLLGELTMCQAAVGALLGRLARSSH